MKESDDKRQIKKYLYCMLIFHILIFICGINPMNISLDEALEIIVLTNYNRQI